MDSTSQHDQSPDNRTRVAIDPHLIFSHRAAGSRTMYIAHHPVLGKFFQLGPEEYRVATLLDGERGLHEILEILKADGIEWRAEEVAEFISRLVAHKLAGMIPVSDPGLTNAEPTALAAGVERGVNQPSKPEASAYGSRRTTDSSGHPIPLPQNIDGGLFGYENVFHVNVLGERGQESRRSRLVYNNEGFHPRQRLCRHSVPVYGTSKPISDL